MGQTHRGKLQENEDLKAYNPANEISFPGNHRGRGIRGGQLYDFRISNFNRHPWLMKMIVAVVVEALQEIQVGGGMFPCKTKFWTLIEFTNPSCSERAALVKRSRTVKGSPTTSQPLAKASTRAKPASPMKHTTSTRSNGQVAGNGHAPTSKQARARSPVRPPPTKAPSRERSRPRANFAGQLATPADFMASVRRPQTPSVTTVQPVTQPRLASEAVVKSEALPEARTIVDSPKNLNARQRAVDTDLIDFDDDQPTPRQATIDFTHPSEEATKVKDASSKPNTLTDPVVVTFAVLEAIIHYVKELDTIGISYQLSTQQLQSVTSLLTKQQLQIVADWYDHEELNMLQRYAAKELETRVAAEKAKAVVHNKPAKPSAYTPADMLALRPKTGVSSAKIASATRSPRPKLATTPAEPSQTQDIVPSPTLSVAVTSPGSESTSVQAIAIQSAAYRAYIVGEHIHKSRYQRPSSSSTAESGELRSADDAKSQPVAPPVKMTGPSLPAHLAGHPPVTDHGAAMRQQYGVTTARPTSSVFPHLRDRTNIENQGITVCSR